MATITSKHIIDQMIKDNGETYVSTGEPPVMRIVEYKNFNGDACWGVVWHNEPMPADRYLQETEWVREPKVIWEREDLLKTHSH